MNIIYIHQYFKTPSDSGGTRSYEFGLRFVKAGHTVNLITSENKSGALSSLSVENFKGINIFKFYIPYSNKMSYYARIRAFIQFAVSATFLLFKMRGDLIYASSTPLTVGAPALIGRKLLGIPFVFEVRDLWPDIPISIGAVRNKILISFLKCFEKYIYNKSSAIIALSEGMKDGIIKKGINHEKIHIVPNSCDFELFDVPFKSGLNFRMNHGFMQDSHLIVYTGTLGEINGVGYLVKVANCMKLINPNVHFLVVGDGKEFIMIEDDAKMLGILNNNFHMIGELIKNEIPNVLSAADIVLSLFIDLPEMQVNSANKFFDALAAGKPLAINYGGWQKDLLEKYNAGVYLDPYNYENAAVKLNETIQNKDLLIQMGANSKNLGKSKFDRDDLANKLLRILEEQHKNHNH